MRGRGGAVRMQWLVVTTVVLHVRATSLGAQALVSPDTTLPAGTITGSVVAAETGVPLEDAVVVLEPAPGGALPAGPHGPAFWEAGLVARTGSIGAWTGGAGVTAQICATTRFTAAATRSGSSSCR